MTTQPTPTSTPGTTQEKLPEPVDPRLKKIYVYAEGTFVIRNAQDSHTISIKTPAFDVSGWIDLSRMRPSGDTVYTEVQVSFANRQNVRYSNYVWQNPQLVALADMTNGRNYLSGTHIDIVVTQTSSADNFATPLEFAYQFIVESQ
ncbi:MAG TPA: hypothetical protein VEK73_08275 [Xanthobacteraceae bacterium]|nr:hypothetical protein [Xanthobacteraceae bacterium]